MKTFYTALMLAAVSLGVMGTAMADDITADVLTYDGKTKVVSAKGNVVIHANEGATITGTNGEYHFEDRSAFLEGGVKYVKEQSTLTAEKMYLYSHSCRQISQYFWSFQSTVSSLWLFHLPDGSFIRSPFSSRS